MNAAISRRKQFSVVLCGLATSVATAIAVTVVGSYTEFRLYTYSVWFVLPAGAFLLGAVASSGSVLASLYLHMRPTGLMLLQMTILAGATQLLIYYLEYIYLLDIGDGMSLTDYVSFFDYLKWDLASAKYSLVGETAGTGALGEAGYWMAAAQFVGFLAGGFSAFAYLSLKPVCSACQKYLRQIASLKKRFTDFESLAKYHDTLFETQLNSPEFADLLVAERDAKAAKGAGLLAIYLDECPQCKAQFIRKKISICDGDEWKELTKLAGSLPVPAGFDLVDAFKTKRRGNVASA